MNRTTVTLPESAVEELRRLRGARSKADAVRSAVEEAIAYQKQILWLEQTRGKRHLHPNTAGWRDRIGDR
ncbi:MAG: hypothetical protein HYT87_05295 [Nitrospirae bacterium]|nr:hypothetical protein [Nitrospirota bacterium]